MLQRAAPPCSARLAMVALAAALLAPLPAAAQDAAKGTAVTVLRATKACFAATVEVAGVLIPRSEVPVGAPRDGLKLTEVLADPGDLVSAGQALARLGTPDGAAVTLSAPVAGLVSASTALIGMTAARQAEPLFKIIANAEFDLAAQAGAADMRRLKTGQTAAIHVAGAGAADGKVRQVATAVEPNTQLGRVFISVETSRRLLANAAAQATIQTGESCGIAVPLTAVLYGGGATVVQVVRHDRVETRRVETGLMSGGQIEIREGLSEGDVVVARAGALLREGDPVRPIAAEVSATTTTEASTGAK
ncbi:MAG: HlyD family efflux transporter periplasmic adaptor subunit [Xanthobacteraceae bacterium]